MTGIGLMMIVKDEAHVIGRCLASVRPFVDWWVIADTGSSDGTQGLVREAMAGVPGELVERPWVDFGHNRQEVLELARKSVHRRKGDYGFWIDADEELQDAPEPRPQLTRAGYYLPTVHTGTGYTLLRLVRLDEQWRWRDPIHEYLDLPGADTGSLDAPVITTRHDGARSRDPQTYHRDAALIERALRSEPGNARLQFYLAQSYRDAGLLEKALAAYRARMDNTDGWDQERWQSRFQSARLLERLGRGADEVVAAHLEAYQHCPWRAEPLVEAARVERERGRHHVALLYARVAASIPMPAGEGLFVERDAYEWRAWDEVAVSCYWTGQYAEGVTAAKRALAANPEDERLRANLEWCRKGLAG